MTPIREEDLTSRDRRLLAEGGGLYSHPHRTVDGGLSCILRLIYTYAIVHDLNDYGYEDRWCYRTEAQSRAALAAWSGEEDTEPEGWIRHPASDRRGTGHPLRETSL